MINRLISFFSLALLLFLSACHQPSKPVANQLKVSQSSDPQTLDPRQARNLETATTLHMLYEGLMRTDEKGKIVPGIAEKVDVSPDQKTYTFSLRPSVWSNEEPVTASDFEQTWKSLLSPDFAAPNAYQFYPIKGAQAAKEGKISLEEVGIHAPDETTLIVELEQPLAHFLNLVSTHFYYPVHSTLRENKNASTTDSTFVSNGPFKLDHWSRNNELTAIKNPLYWDEKNVHLEKVSLIVLDDNTALHLFENKELDWTGSPLSTLPTDSLAALRTEGILKTAPGAGTHWFRFNTEKKPFDNASMRTAFALALNRQELIDHVLQGNQQAALQIVPPSFNGALSLHQDHNIEKAQHLFKESQEHNEELAAITLCYRNDERSHKIAQVVQQQWKEAFNLTVNLQSCESKVLFDHLKTGEYQIGLGSWYADFRDPISFLDVFKFKDNGTNNTQWENEIYTALLEGSSSEANEEKRAKLLQQAEKILLREMPVIPLFHAAYNYLQQPRVEGVYFSELGYLDFKHAKLQTDL